MHILEEWENNNKAGAKIYWVPTMSKCNRKCSFKGRFINMKRAIYTWYIKWKMISDQYENKCE